MAFLDAPIHIERDDADLYVEQVGPQEAQSIYFLHGGPGYSSFSFRDLIGEELEAYRLLYADQRGSGRSYAHSPFTLDDLAGDVDTVLASLQVPGATLLAHGFGALVAVRAALGADRTAAVREPLVLDAAARQAPAAGSAYRRRPGKRRGR